MGDRLLTDYQGGILQNQMDFHISEYLCRQDCENRGA